MAKAEFSGKGLELKFNEGRIIHRPVYEVERILDREWFISIDGQVYQVLGSYDPKENKLVFDEKIGPSIEGAPLGLAGLTQVLNQNVHINERAVLVPYDKKRDIAIYEKGKYNDKEPILLPLVKRILKAKEGGSKSFSDTSVNKELEKLFGDKQDSDVIPLAGPEEETKQT